MTPRPSQRVYETRPPPYAERAYSLPETGQEVINVTNGKLIRALPSILQRLAIVDAERGLPRLPRHVGHGDALADLPGGWSSLHPAARLREAPRQPRFSWRPALGMSYPV